MTDQTHIVVVVETKKRVTGSADWKGLHICDYMNTGQPAFSDMSGLDNRLLSQDETILLFAVSQAAKELGCHIEIRDLAQLGYMQRRQQRREFAQIPCLLVGNRILSGLPTKAQIVLFYLECTELSHSDHAMLENSIA